MTGNGEKTPVEKCPECGWGTTYHGGREGVTVCPNCGWDNEGVGDATPDSPTSEPASGSRDGEL